LPSDKEFFWAFDFPILPEFTPSISTTEVGLFNLGEMALDRFLGNDASGIPIYGTMNQTLMQIDCIDQNKDGYNRATKKVRNLRDRVVCALTDANELIPLLDYDNPLKPTIGWIRLDNSSNSINEKFLTDPSNQQLRRYTILVRIFWMEINQNSFTQTITSNATVV
jgi:hypothetical protein